MSDHDSGHILLAFLAGAAAGAVAAMLLTPRTGAETREQLAGYYNQGRERYLRYRGALPVAEEAEPAPAPGKKS
jgi:hypothetical protein